MRSEALVTALAAGGCTRQPARLPGHAGEEGAAVLCQEREQSLARRAANQAPPLVPPPALPDPPLPAPSPATEEDGRFCSTIDEVAAEVGWVYADANAVEALIAEHAASPEFQKAIRDTVQVLRDSDGMFEGDAFAAVCAPAG